MMKPTTLHVVYILPSRYDDDGYIYRYWRGLLPSNTLAVLRTLTQALAQTQALGCDVALRVETFDESVEAVPIRRLLREARRKDEQLVVGLVGVQSNMFSRASDLAVTFRGAGIPVLIGGFHVSGVLATFEAPTPELRYLLDRGVSLVQGEVEGAGVLAGILRDAWKGNLERIYRIAAAPDLADAPVPQPDADYMRHFMESMGTIDTSRGCPFNCSFCTIVNVQGRKMRHRSARVMLRSIEENHARGFRVYFFTDDNLARSPVWEALFDGLIDLRRRGKPVRFMMQIDTQAWRIPRFVEKASAAGCYAVFIGMESVNPANLEATGKKQNKVGEFADMVEAWHQAHILVHVGYIIGLPHDTEESVRQDVATLKDEIKVDQASFFMLTPLPGSRDHREMVEKRIPIDADLNNFDSCHETFRHPNFKPGAWRAAFDAAWQSFYCKENMVNILLRTPVEQYWNVFWLDLWNCYATLLQTHPMVMGLFRLRGRKNRRPELPRESWVRYAWRRATDTARQAKAIGRVFFEFQEIWMLTRRKDDPRWATLAKLRERWACAQQRLAEADLSGRCDLAIAELRDTLRTSAAYLEQLAGSGRHLSGRVRRRICEKTQEIDAYVRNLDIQMPTWRSVFQLENYIRENLLSGYEEAAIRYVAQRRRFNAYRRELMRRLKTGRVWTLDILPVPRLLFFELVLGIRFGLASLRQL